MFDDEDRDPEAGPAEDGEVVDVRFHEHHKKRHKEDNPWRGKHSHWSLTDSVIFGMDVFYSTL